MREGAHLGHIAPIPAQLVFSEAVSAREHYGTAPRTRVRTCGVRPLVRTARGG